MTNGTLWRTEIEYEVTNKNEIGKIKTETLRERRRVDPERRRSDNQRTQASTGSGSQASAAAAARRMVLRRSSGKSGRSRGEQSTTESRITEHGKNGSNE